MKRYDSLVTVKISKLAKNKLVEESTQRKISLSELIRLRINEFRVYNNEDIPAMKLNWKDYLILKRCPRCSQIYSATNINQIFCSNYCGCGKSPQAILKREKILII
jgi:hypothetical protein